MAPTFSRLSRHMEGRVSALDEKQCRRTFHLDRPDCRACAGYKTSCPDFHPRQDEMVEDRGKGEQHEHLEDT